MSRYLVFARERYDEPLERRGDLEADSEDAARTAAPDDERFIEIQLGPDSELRWVVRRD